MCRTHGAYSSAAIATWTILAMSCAAGISGETRAVSRSRGASQWMGVPNGAGKWQIYRIRVIGLDVLWGLPHSHCHISPSCTRGQAKRWNEILLARQLCVSRCEVFRGDHLLYLFYGRPAYRPKNDDKTSLELWRALITFVINQAAINHIARIFPFDSGAYATGRYAPYIEAQFSVEEFQLPSEATIPQKIVGAFFGTNSDYWGRKNSVLVVKMKSIHWILIHTFTQT